MRALRQAVILLCCLSLTACGFHLRGPVKLAPPLHDLYIESNDPYGPLVRNIKEYLKASDVDIADSPAEAATTLQILSENRTDQLLSVGGTQQTRQYNLILSVAFQVKRSDGKILIPAQTISDTRSITIESDQILGGSNEANNLYNQMERSIVYLLMNRLSSKSASDAVNGIPPLLAYPSKHSL